MTRPDYIFIVGLARTGTTLIRNILNRSDEVGIGGESRYFGDTRRLGLFPRQGFQQHISKIGDISTDDGARNVVDRIFSVDQNNFWGKIVRNTDYEEFLRRLLESDRSDRALLDVAMSFYANGKPIRGEKTPAHIHFVPTLLDWFPNAKIIHTFRDPRAVYISNKRKSEKRDLPASSRLFRKTGLPFELYSSFDVIISWFRVIRLHQHYQQLYPDRYYLSKYEQLIVDPRASLQKLCDFLGIDFTEAMLQQTVTNSSFLPREQVQGFDSSTVDRWRQHLHPWIHQWFIFWCKNQLLAFDYPL